MTRWPVFLLLAIAARMTQAELPAPDDFATGLELDVDGAHAIYRVELPDTVYANVIRPDLGDLRVFNAADEALPHTLRQLQAEESVSNAAVTLPFFPLETVEHATGATTTFNFATSREGAVVRMESAPASTTDRYITHYLVDASQINKPIDRLEFHWEGDQGEFISKVDIDYSSDLTHWTTLRNKVSLARLVFQGHNLEQTGIALSVPAKSYLRITWPAGRDGVALKSLTAYTTTRTHTLSRQWGSVIARKTGENPLAYEFTRRAHSTIDRINLQLPAHNTLVEATLSSRNTAEQAWHLRYRGVFYRLKIGAHELGNAEISIASTTDQEWRLDIHSDASGLDKEGPQLMLGTRPQELYFMVRGNPPFILALGSATVIPTRTPVDMLLASVSKDQHNNLVGTARIAGQITLGGEARRLPPPLPLPWKQWLLWGVLLAGVVVLALMALRLHRQMRA